MKRHVLLLAIASYWLGGDSALGQPFPPPRTTALKTRRQRMKTRRSIAIAVLTQTVLVLLQPVPSTGCAPLSTATESIDVVAPGPRFETEPVETNSNVDLEADTRDKDYTLGPLPTGAPLATLEFVSPGAGGSGHAAKITAEAGQAGILTRTIPADKGRRITFSDKIRSEGIESVGLVAVPVPRRPQRWRPTGPAAAARRPLRAAQPPGSDVDSPPRPQARRQPPRPGADTPRAQRPSRPFPPRSAGPRTGPGPRPPRGLAIDRSKTLSGTFDWTTLSLDTTFRTNFDEAQFQVVVRGPGTVWIDDVSVNTHLPKTVDVPQQPLAPLYVMTMMHSETPRAYITNRDYFRADAMKYEEMAKMLHRYGARLVIQPERELWLGAKQYDPDFLRRLHEEYGVSFSVHTHGPDPNTSTDQEVLDYVRLRKEEMEAMGAGPVTDTNGNFEREDWGIFARIGIRTVTSYKHPPTQLGLMAMQHYYLHPWRPGGSPFESEEQFARHNPDCGVVFLPGVGADHTRNHELFADLIERHLRVALSRVRADRINVTYFVEHVGRFVSKGRRQSPWEYVNSQAFRDDLNQHEKLYRDFLAPLVESGHVRYVGPAEVCDLFEQWEQKMGIAAAGTANAAAQDAGGTLRSDDVKGYITFAINTHDWMHVDQSADILLRLIELFEKYDVRGDFYLTAPMTHHYAESRPDVIRRLRDSKMTISYHVRPPHILYPGFNGRLRGLDDALAKTLRDYETYRLDMTTGQLLRDQPGGCQYVAATFGRKPVALGVPTGSPRERRAARRGYRELGAKVIVEHHESGTKLDRPFEWVDGLLMRPSDFSVTRWAAPGDRPGRRGLGNFWWNMLSTPRAANYNPTAYLKKRLAEWNGPREPIITCLIHENNFYRARSTPWALVYYADVRKSRPLRPPFDLDAPDASVARSPADRQAIWRAYEEIVAYAAANLKVVTSEDVARMAESAPHPHAPDSGPAEQQ